MEYRIETEYGPEDLQTKVNNLILLGWLPCGGVAVEQGRTEYQAARYSQAMTSTSESREAAARLRDHRAPNSVVTGKPPCGAA